MDVASKLVPPLAPGPPLIGLASEFFKDPLGLFSRASRWGPVVRVPIGPRTLILVSGPDEIEEILIKEQRAFSKGTTLKAAERVLGHGLLSSEGDFWRRQRRLSQPAFHHSRIQQYGKTMVSYTTDQMGDWRTGQTRDMAREMSALTLKIAAKTLFDADVLQEIDAVGEALVVSLRQFVKGTRTLWKIPPSWPTPSNIRFEKAAQTLDRMVDRIISERMTSGDDRGDLLSMLLEARDDEGQPMTRKQVRDEVMTLLLAGHETTANALSWTFFLLSENPLAREALEKELNQGLGGRPPRPEDLTSLPFTSAVLTESMRLFPPAWTVIRAAAQPVVVGGYGFPQGTEFIISQWVVHRQETLFDEASSFRPQRWLDGLQQRLPRFAYFPFGGGPRLCIGREFALMEAGLILATIAQSFRLDLVPGSTVTPLPSITLRPKEGVPMTLVRPP